MIYIVNLLLTCCSLCSFSGGLIALALGKTDKTLDDIEKIIIEIREEVFSKPLGNFNWFFTGDYYDSSKLKDILSKHFGDTVVQVYKEKKAPVTNESAIKEEFSRGLRMNDRGELSADVMAVLSNAQTKELVYVRAYDDEGRPEEVMTGNDDAKDVMLIRDIALASVSTHNYFMPVRIGTHGWPLPIRMKQQQQLLIHHIVLITHCLNSFLMLTAGAELCAAVTNDLNYGAIIQAEMHRRYPGSDIGLCLSLGSDPLTAPSCVTFLSAAHCSEELESDYDDTFVTLLDEGEDDERSRCKEEEEKWNHIRLNPSHQNPEIACLKWNESDKARVGKATLKCKTWMQSDEVKAMLKREWPW